MATKIIHKTGIYLFVIILVAGCAIPPGFVPRKENKTTPASFTTSRDSSNNLAKVKWKTFFADANLAALIDTALKNNQELNIIMQEIAISKNEVMARKGEYLPAVSLQGGGGSEKVARYTWPGSIERNVEIKDGPDIPKTTTDYQFGAIASWELDVWKKLRNAKAAAVARYLSSVEGKNFAMTNLIAEVADSYYELMALDNMLDIVEKNITIQSDALHIVREQKEAAKVTQLAVNRFEAQLLNTQSLQYEIKQKITETENRINFLTGRFPTPIIRSSSAFTDIRVDSIQAGVPSQLLVNRPDIRQAELNLAATKLDVAAARAAFYPSFRIVGGVGFKAFNPSYLINPESMVYNLAGDLMAPLINRNAIKAMYYSANSKQIQAVYNYERTILNAHVDVLNQLAKVDNYSKSFNTKSKEVAIMVQSVDIANKLFYSARADYAEVLLTQREALEAKMQLVEIKLKQISAKVNIYRALGGGWN